MSEYNARVAVVLSIALLGFVFAVIVDAFEKGYIIGTTGKRDHVLVS